MQLECTNVALHITKVSRIALQQPEMRTNLRATQLLMYKRLVVTSSNLPQCPTMPISSLKGLAPTPMCVCSFPHAMRLFPWMRGSMAGGTFFPPRVPAIDASRRLTILDDETRAWLGVPTSAFPAV